MDSAIESFISYLSDVKKKSQNTLLSYRRDLHKLSEYMTDMGVSDVAQITFMDLSSYVAWMEDEHMAPASISRKIACFRGFFQYLLGIGEIDADVSTGLKPPKAEKAAPKFLTPEEVVVLLKQPCGKSPKALRDKAMLELMYATGLRVSELIVLEISDLDMRSGFIRCKGLDAFSSNAPEYSSNPEMSQRFTAFGERHIGRRIPFGQSAKKALKDYLDDGRASLIGLNKTETLFVNCSGIAMSRQGFWKLLKTYAASAGIEKDITPQTLRHSFALHLVGNGADLKSVQEMLGHAGSAATQMYASIKTNKLRDVYTMSHPLG